MKLALDELNPTNKMERKLVKKIIDSLVDLRMMIEEIEKINNNKRLEVEKIKDTTRKVLKEFKTEKTEELE